MIVCLCPTFGRPALLANTIAMFEKQSLEPEKRVFLALDDSGLASYNNGHRWDVLAVESKIPTLTSKYALMMRIVADMHPNWTAIAMMDDDDIFGPHWLRSHVETFESKPANHPILSKPSTVLSLHSPPAKSKTQPGPECSRGRFWSSIAINRVLFENVDGFHESESVAYDQEHIAKFETNGELIDCCVRYGPQYVYGWGRSNHCSSASGDGWYRDHRPMSKDPGQFNNLAPKMDPQTAAVYDSMGWSRSKVEPIAHKE